MKQRFEIEVEVGERISAYKLGLMIHSLEGIGGCYAKEVFIGDEPATKEHLHEYNKLRAAVINYYGVETSPLSELYPKISTELNKIRRELVIQALEEVLPGLFNVTRYEQDPVVHSRYVAVILNAKGIKIKHFITDASPAMPSDICCIYKDETPIHFFNYL